MKLFEDLPSQNMPITAENLNQIQDNLVVVSATEPTGDNREKVWMQNSDTEIKIYIKDDNNVYEVFFDKDDILDKYSTEEQIVGTWIDGKTLYRKVFKVSTPTVETDGTYVYLATDTTNLNIDFGFVKYACLQDDKYTFPLPYTNSSGYSVKAYYNQNFKNFEIASNGKSYNEQHCYVELNYTKTTD